MSVDVKICGINSPEAMKSAVSGGVKYTGFVFYPPSPRAVSAAQAADLAALAPSTVKKVGLFVDPTDEELDLVLNELKLDIVQLHGNEMPERIAQIRARFRTPVMKAIPVATGNDLRNVSMYEAMVDIFLFDAKPVSATARKPPTPSIPSPSASGFGSFDMEALDSFLDTREPAPKTAPRRESSGPLPGGNGETFDWQLLRGLRTAKPWMLAGGINAENLSQAVGVTMAKIVDVSSGVEDSPGRKSPDKIRTFLALAASL